MISILLLLVIVCSSLQSTDVILSMHFTDQRDKSRHDFCMISQSILDVSKIRRHKIVSKPIIFPTSDSRILKELKCRIEVYLSDIDMVKKYPDS